MSTVNPVGYWKVHKLQDKEPHLQESQFFCTALYLQQKYPLLHSGRKHWKCYHPHQLKIVFVVYLIPDQWQSFLHRHWKMHQDKPAGFYLLLFHHSSKAGSLNNFCRHIQIPLVFLHLL